MSGEIMNWIAKFNLNPKNHPTKLSYPSRVMACHFFLDKKVTKKSRLMNI
jgi:hypothetical protein